MPLSDNQFARLPKAAQDEIERLRASVEHWKAKYSAGPQDSTVFAGRIASGREIPGRPLGHENVVLVYGDDEHDEYVEVRIAHGWVEVRGAAGLPLHIQPLHSNTIRVRVSPEEGR